MYPDCLVISHNLRWTSSALTLITVSFQQQYSKAISMDLREVLDSLADRLNQQLPLLTNEEATKTSEPLQNDRVNHSLKNTVRWKIQSSEMTSSVVQSGNKPRGACMTTSCSFFLLNWHEDQYNCGLPNLCLTVPSKRHTIHIKSEFSLGR